MKPVVFVDPCKYLQAIRSGWQDTPIDQCNFGLNSAPRAAELAVGDARAAEIEAACFAENDRIVNQTSAFIVQRHSALWALVGRQSGAFFAMQVDNFINGSKNFFDIIGVVTIRVDVVVIEQWDRGGVDCGSHRLSVDGSRWLLHRVFTVAEETGDVAQVGEDYWDHIGLGLQLFDRFINDESRLRLTNLLV